MHRPASQRANGHEVFFSRIRIEVTLFPIRTAIIQEVLATGGAKVVGDQPSGSQFFYHKISHTLCAKSFFDSNHGLFDIFVIIKRADADISFAAFTKSGPRCADHAGLFEQTVKKLP